MTSRIWPLAALVVIALTLTFALATRTTGPSPATVRQLLHDDMDAVQVDITASAWADCRTNAAIYNADADAHPDDIPAGMPRHLDLNDYCGATT